MAGKAPSVKQVTGAAAVADFLGLQLPSGVTSAYVIAQTIEKQFSGQKHCSSQQELDAHIANLEIQLQNHKKELERVKAANLLICSERDRLSAQLRALKTSPGGERPGQLNEQSQKPAPSTGRQGR